MMPVPTMTIEAMRHKTNKFEILRSFMAGIIGPTVAMVNIIMVMSRAHFSIFNRGGWESVKMNTA